MHVLAEQGCTDSLSLVLRAGCSEGIGKVADKVGHVASVYVDVYGCHCMMYYLSWHFHFQDRCTPLHLAVRMGRLGAVQTLLDVEGPRKSINYQDKVHRNPHWKKMCLQM